MEAFGSDEKLNGVWKAKKQYLWEGICIMGIHTVWWRGWESQLPKMLENGNVQSIGRKIVYHHFILPN